MADVAKPTHVTAPATSLLDRLPRWATLVRADNPGPMTLDGTNTWVLRAGDGPAVVVDPGPALPAHLRSVAAHGPFAAILLTHGHPDHLGGLAEFRDLVGDVPVYGIGATAPGRGDRTGADPGAAAADFGAGADHAAGADVGGVPGAVPDGGAAAARYVTRTFTDGQALRFGDLEITVLATPGHTADSVCLLVDGPAAGPVGADGAATRERAVLSGDTILGQGTTVVAWPDGNLGGYLDSLDRLAALGAIPVLPGHGPALVDCAAAATFYSLHRRARLAQVRSAVAAGADTAEKVVAAVYADVDRALWPAAAWSVRAQLAYLAERRTARDGAPYPADVAAAGAAATGNGAAGAAVTVTGAAGAAVTVTGAAGAAVTVTGAAGPCAATPERDGHSPGPVSRGSP